MLNKGIPISVSLQSSFKNDQTGNLKYNKKRLFNLSLLAVLIAVSISIVAKLLIYLIDFITNVSFYGSFSFSDASPAHNSLGLWVIIVPAVGGLIVGILAFYGSKAIRGHGIPEAMEQILTNQSKIKPSITFLKPISSAISIGTGGPFGAEGPIIATGGALGSTLGQVMKITPNERKILLAAGATAGMSAIFGAPVAAILLAIELLLFEFSPRSFIPVALACITGSAGHHFFFGEGVVFPMKVDVESISNAALFFYSAMGIVVGVLAVATTKIVYWIEDSFEKLPVHWAWWPAIGGVVVGIVGYFEPRTLGVGYNNITDLLSGSLTLQVVVSLCVLKFISWAVSLGSGTSGGTLAPLLTIGGALGVLLGFVGNQWFPAAEISIPLAALIGMSAMFAGASRAFLTSIVFALETTGQSNALLPLLASCTASYFISYFLMENTIMTEKIARRGVYTPSTYEPDVLEKIKVEQLATDNGITISEDMKLGEVRSWLQQEPDLQANYYIISSTDGKYIGLLSSTSIFSSHHPPDTLIGSLVKRTQLFVSKSDSLKMAVQTMAKENVDILPVVSEKEIVGILTYHHIISVYNHGIDELETKQKHISLKRQRLKILLRGQKLVNILRTRSHEE